MGFVDWFTAGFAITPFDIVQTLIGFMFAGFVVWRQEAIVRGVQLVEKHLRETDITVNYTKGQVDLLVSGIRRTK